MQATEFANSRILEELQLEPEDTLLDIGCGDGCLLRMAAGRVAKRIGIVPSVEEQLKLQRALPDVTFRMGVAQTLPLDSESVSKIACNSVLLLLASQEAAVAALKEIARVARPDARVLLGEIPAQDELASFGMYRGNSVAGLLWNSFKRKGLSSGFELVKTVVAAMTGRHTLVLNSSHTFHAPPDKFMTMAGRCGLRAVSHYKYERLDRSGNVVESPFRYNYIFVR